jgi:2-aminoadipate transaminase
MEGPAGFSRPFFVDGSGQNTLRLNYSNSDEAQIGEGIQRLAQVVRELMAQKVTVRPSVKR